MHCELHQNYTVIHHWIDRTIMKNVLVVDSDPVMLQTLISLLKSQGEFLNVLASESSNKAIGFASYTNHNDKHITLLE